MESLQGPTESYPYALLEFTDQNKPAEYCQGLESQGTSYGLGAKADPLGCDLSQIRSIDCSGFVRDCLYRSLGRPDDFDFPDGSVDQHEWVKAKGFKESTVQDASDHDSIWRVAYLSPESMSEGIGHTLLIRDGQTCESYGGHGPGSREWLSESFMEKMSVYVLAMP
jgi:hypothetical protein